MMASGLNCMRIESGGGKCGAARLSRLGECKITQDKGQAQSVHRTGRSLSADGANFPHPVAANPERNNAKSCW